ncbi:hypothetical protein D3C72_2335040 [compost metagenome]
MSHRAKAHHILQQNEAGSDDLNILEIHIHHFASWIIRSPETIHAEALARRPAGDEVNLVAQASKLIFVLA